MSKASWQINKLALDRRVDVVDGSSVARRSKKSEVAMKNNKQKNPIVNSLIGLKEFPVMSKTRRISKSDLKGKRVEKLVYIGRQLDEYGKQSYWANQIQKRDKSGNVDFSIQAKFENVMIYRKLLNNTRGIDGGRFSRLLELEGCTLLDDVNMNEPSHGDVIINAINYILSEARPALASDKEELDTVLPEEPHPTSVESDIN